MDLWLAEFCFARKLFERLCEERQRRSNPEDLDWIAAPPVAARDDESDGMPMGLVSVASVSPTFLPRVAGGFVHDKF